MNGNGQSPLSRIERNLDRLTDILEHMATVAGRHDQQIREQEERLREQEQHRLRLEKTVAELAAQQKQTQQQLKTLRSASGRAKARSSPSGS
jgi:phage shock protein A